MLRMGCVPLYLHTPKATASGIILVARNPLSRRHGRPVTCTRDEVRLATSLLVSGRPGIQLMSRCIVSCESQLAARWPNRLGEIAGIRVSIPGRGVYSSVIGRLGPVINPCTCLHPTHHVHSRYYIHT